MQMEEMKRHLETQRRANERLATMDDAEEEATVRVVVKHPKIPEKPLIVAVEIVAKNHTAGYEGVLTFCERGTAVHQTVAQTEFPLDYPCLIRV